MLTADLTRGGMVKLEWNTGERQDVPCRGTSTEFRAVVD